MEDGIVCNDSGSPLWMTVSREEYVTARGALNDIEAQKSSMNRIVATVMMSGGRMHWAAIAALYEDTAKGIGCNVDDIKIIQLWQDQTATATIETDDDNGIVQ